MYCPQCNKEGVDFNSVAVSQPTSAFTMDMDGPVDPTVVRSSSTVINVCKNCGSQDLFPSAAAHSAAIRQVREVAQRDAREAEKAPAILLYTVGIGLIGGLGATWWIPDWLGFVGGFLGFAGIGNIVVQVVMLRGLQCSPADEVVLPKEEIILPEEEIILPDED